jgi:5-hydroxyisourate hydrolase
MKQISTHVLDVALGRPAAGVAVVLEFASPGGAWTEIGRDATDGDGRVKNLAPAGVTLVSGDYRLRFAVGVYFEALGQAPFYPEATVHVRLDSAVERYHLPLLLSPFAYSTYRGT